MKYRTLAVAVMVITAAAAFALKPKWVANTPHELNDTYKFVDVVTYGSTVDAARALVKDGLTDDLQIQNGLEIKRRTKQTTTIDKHRVDGGRLHEDKRDNIVVELQIDGETFRVQAVPVDEYAENKNGQVELHSLYMVAMTDNPVFDRAHVTTHYGFTPVAMSIIPGLGQLYKGSKGKAAAFFGSTALSVSAIIVCDNQRATYMKKCTEQPKFAKYYRNKADNWETGRNVSIGIAAGIWLYNIIDAACAKGARKVDVTPAARHSFGVTPFATADGAAGLTLSYNF